MQPASHAGIPTLQENHLPEKVSQLSPVFEPKLPEVQSDIHFCSQLFLQVVRAAGGIALHPLFLTHFPKHWSTQNCHPTGLSVSPISAGVIVPPVRLKAALI